MLPIRQPEENVDFDNDCSSPGLSGWLILLREIELEKHGDSMDSGNGNDNGFMEAVKSGDITRVNRLLSEDRSLAGKNTQPESLHSEGFPLFHAARNGDLEMVRLLLEHGADPDARLDIDEPRETGMPLMNAFHGGHLEIVHLLLDHGADLNAFPWCSTPFVDCVCNAMWDEPEQSEMTARLIRKSYDHYLRPNVDTEARTVVEQQSPGESAMLRLLRRVVRMGGRPSLFTVVRHEQHDLIEDLLRHCSKQPGTVMDWPRGTVFENICYAASWCGYPRVINQCRELCPELFTPDVARQSIERAIRSHNRDGNIDDYSQMIESLLNFLKANDELGNRFSRGEPFLPLHLLAEDFIEPRTYGFKCKQLSTEADLIRLARLFVKHGFDASTSHSKTGLTPLQIARNANRMEAAGYFKTQATGADPDFESNA